MGGHDNYRIIKLLLEINALDEAPETLRELLLNFPTFYLESLTSIDLLAELLQLNFFAFLAFPRFLIPLSVYTLHCVCERVRVRETDRDWGPADKLLSFF